MFCNAAFVRSKSSEFSYFLAWINKSKLYLERVEEEMKTEVDIVKDALCVLLCQHCKKHFMDPQQRDQGQGGLGQSGEKDTQKREGATEIEQN